MWTLPTRPSYQKKCLVVPLEGVVQIVKLCEGGFQDNALMILLPTRPSYQKKCLTGPTP